MPDVVAVYVFGSAATGHYSAGSDLDLAVLHRRPLAPRETYDLARKIEAAADHGIDAFIFDWYYYNEDESGLAGGAWDGSKYLYKALEEGFLAAPNNDRLKFGIMWCNHNLGDKVKGAVKPETFEKLTDYVIENYFKHPSYWKINGCPYFSIYEVNTFIETFGGDRDAAAAALEKFREKTKAAGFPGLHLNGVLYGLGGADRNGTVAALGLDSVTSYVWIHHYSLPDFPATDYQQVADGYFAAVENGGGANGLGQAAKHLPAPYHPNVSMGWDSSPRCPPEADWMKERVYPFGAIITTSTLFLGSMRPKCTLRPWAKAIAAPSRMLSAISFL
jgi:predicted nucleotidyltransferase